MSTFKFDTSSAPLSVGFFEKNNNIYYIKDTNSPENKYYCQGEDVWLILEYPVSENKQNMLKFLEYLTTFGITKISDRELISQLEDDFACGGLKAPHFLAWMPANFNNLRDLISIEDYKLIVEYWMFS